MSKDDPEDEAKEGATAEEVEAEEPRQGPWMMSFIGSRIKSENSYNSPTFGLLASEDDGHLPIEDFPYFKGVDVVFLQGHGNVENRNKKDEQGKSLEKGHITIFAEKETTSTAISKVHDKLHPNTYVISACYGGSAAEDVGDLILNDPKFQPGTTIIIAGSSKHSTKYGKGSPLNNFKNRLEDAAERCYYRSTPLDSVALFGKESVRCPETLYFIRLVGEGEARRVVTMKSRSPKEAKDIAHLTSYFNAEPTTYDPKDKERDEKGVATQRRDHLDKHLVITSGDPSDREVSEVIEKVKAARAETTRNLINAEIQRYKDEALYIATSRSSTDRIKDWLANGADPELALVVAIEREVEVFEAIYEGMKRYKGSEYIDHIKYFLSAAEVFKEAQEGLVATQQYEEKERREAAAWLQEIEGDQTDTPEEKRDKIEKAHSTLDPWLAKLSKETMDENKKYQNSLEIGQFVYSHAPDAQHREAMMDLAKEIGLEKEAQFIISAINPEKESAAAASPLPPKMEEILKQAGGQEAVEALSAAAASPSSSKVPGEPSPSPTPAPSGTPTLGAGRNLR